jgi:hypothetical protein
MAKFNRKRPSLTAHDASINGEPCTLYTRRPSTRDLLKIAQLGGEMRRATKGSIDADGYGRAVSAIAEWVEEIEGIEDEDGATLAWADLGADEREQLLMEIDLHAALRIFTALADAGRLNASEKKASAPTSPPSSAEIAADAPSAPEEPASPV